MATSSTLGGLAAAVVVKGGSEIEDDCEQWLEQHGPLAVGQAMATRAGKLPCRFVIHAVGPSVGFGRVSNTGADLAHLRSAVRSALCEAERLQVASVALPVISSGHFGFPVALAATEIVNECVQYAFKKGGGTSLQTIVLVGRNGTEYGSFGSALQAAAASTGASFTVDEQTDLSFLAQVDHSQVQAPEQSVEPVPKALAPWTPFENLAPDSTEYQWILKTLPDSRRVVGVRRVRPSALHVDYEKLKGDLAGARVEEIELYHGTPARWRATAIALRGFDRSLFPGSPTHMTGVYTSVQANFAYRYVRGAGSLVRLRGLVVSNAADFRHNTLVQPPMHVFPNPKALVSTMIIDYSPEDELDRQQLGQR